MFSTPTAVDVKLHAFRLAIPAMLLAFAVAVAVSINAVACRSSSRENFASSFSLTAPPTASPASPGFPDVWAPAGHPHGPLSVLHVRSRHKLTVIIDEENAPLDRGTRVRLHAMLDRGVRMRRYTSTSRPRRSPSLRTVDLATWALFDNKKNGEYEENAVFVIPPPASATAFLTQKTPYSALFVLGSPAAWDRTPMHLGNAARVTYVTDMDLYALKIALRACEVIVKLRRVESRDAQLRMLGTKEEGKLVAHAIWSSSSPGSKEMQEIGSMQNVRMVDYGGDDKKNITLRDFDKIRATYAPLLQTLDVPVATVLPKVPAGPGDIRIYTLLGAPVAVVVGGTPPLLRLVAKAALNEDDDTAAYNNRYVALGVKFHDVTIRLLRDKNTTLTLKQRVMEESVGLHLGRPGTSILEQFSDSGPHRWIVPSKNVDGYVASSHGGKVRTLTVLSSRIDNVPMRVGDRVRLLRQSMGAEANGDYVVVSTAMRKTVLTSPIVIRDHKIDDVIVVADNNDQTQRVRIRVARELVPAGVVLVKGDRVFLSPDGPTGSVVLASAAAKVEILADPPAPTEDFERLHPLALCSKDPLVPSKEMCTELGGVWDRPCERNADCPFYQINHDYKGGCVAGYCEMPVGVKRVGYRHNLKPIPPPQVLSKLQIDV